MLGSGIVFLFVAFIVLVTVTNFGLSLFDLSPVYKLHSENLLLARVLLPFLTVIMLQVGSKGRVGKVFLWVFMLCVVVAFTGCVVNCQLFGNNSQAFKDLKEETRGIHYQSWRDKNYTYAVYSEDGWTREDGETYTLVQYRNVGPYFRKKVREIELPVNHWLSFVSPAKDKLSIELRREQELLLTADVDDILSGRVKLGH